MEHQGEQTSAKASKLTIRDATIDDMDDIWQILYEAFPDDPIVDYRYPRRHEFPEDYEKYRRAELEGYINQTEKFRVQVAVDDNKPVGLAVWDFVPTMKTRDPGTGRDTRRDIDPKHFDFFFERIIECINKHFAPYGDNQLSLRLLGTLPSQRRRGAGSMLVRWGIANANGRPITLFASPQGRFLYEHLKFKWITNEYMGVEGEDEKLTLAVMEYRS